MPGDLRIEAFTEAQPGCVLNSPEFPGLGASFCGGRPCPDKGKATIMTNVNGNADMHVVGESDGSIVPEKQANKTGTPVAELVDERGPPKGKVVQCAFVPVSVPGNTNPSACITTASKDGNISTVAAQGKSRMR